MEAILDQVRDVFEGQIVCCEVPVAKPRTDDGNQDFEGQRLTELISNVLLGFFTVSAMISVGSHN